MAILLLGEANTISKNYNEALKLYLNRLTNFLIINDFQKK